MGGALACAVKKTPVVIVYFSCASCSNIVLFELGCLQAPRAGAAYEHTACTLSFFPCNTHLPRSTCSVEFTAPVQLASLYHVAFTKVDVHVAKR